MDADYPIAINVLGIVAVLIVNITYIGYVTPPGGTHPVWEGCDYPNLTVYFTFNGFAFLSSMCAIWLLLLTPVVKAASKGWHRGAVVGGAATVALAMLFLLIAFTFAGLVSVGYGAPDYTCAVLKCEEGGVYCSRHTYAQESRKLNKFQGRCFNVTGVHSGAALRDIATPLEKIKGYRTDAYDVNSTHFLSTDMAGKSFDDALDPAICYFLGVEVNSGHDDTNFYANNTLCMVPAPFPDGMLAYDLYTVLAQYAPLGWEDRAIWNVVLGQQNLSTMGQSHTNFSQNSTNPLWAVPTKLSIKQCEAMHPNLFSFATMNDVVFTVSKPGGLDGSSATDLAQLTMGDVALAESIKVHEEFSYRCRKWDNDTGDATWCRYHKINNKPVKEGGRKGKKGVKDEESVFQSKSRCDKIDNKLKCSLLAVQPDGSYILENNLAKLVGDGNHIFVRDTPTVTTVTRVVFSILGIGLAVSIIFVVVFVCMQCVSAQG